MYIMSAEYVSIRESVLGKLERNLPEIQRRFGVDTLGIFGSVSRGEDTAESDVDVLYRFDEEHGRLSDIVGLHDYLVQLFGREVNSETRLWDVIVDPARKIRIGNKLYFGPNESLVAEVIDNTTSRGRTVRFLYDGSHEDFIKHIRSLGHTPLPEELRALRNIENFDAERYQTIYAKHEGAVAAPIAGLHFSRELLKRFEIKDVHWEELTLHCGMGNFKDIEVEDLSKHRMDAEEMHVSSELCDTVMNAKVSGHKICVVGTTTMRAVETAVTIPGKMCAYDGWTNKFIYPPYQFSIADMMVTNFHHPKSSQIIMTCAFGGTEFVLHAYETAVREKYKFSTYGDAMLIV